MKKALLVLLPGGSIAIALFWFSIILQVGGYGSNFEVLDQGFVGIACAILIISTCTFWLGLDRSRTVASIAHCALGGWLLAARIRALRGDYSLAFLNLDDTIYDAPFFLSAFLIARWGHLFCTPKDPAPQP